MLQTNPDTAERNYPTLNPPVSVGPGETIDHPMQLPGLLPAGPVATEPGCQHPDCVLEHPHAGPAQLGDADAEPAGEEAAAKPRRRRSE